MQGGTTFHFVTEGIEEALRLAVEAAGDRHVSVCGGASTINQYLAAGHIDELRLHRRAGGARAGARRSSATWPGSASRSRRAARRRWSLT